MTVCGFHLSALHPAVAWIDSETFRNGRPAGHALKLAVNPLAGTVMVGTGSLFAATRAAEILRDVETFDELVKWLPRALEIARPAELQAFAPDTPPSTTLGFVGYSHRARRQIGMVFRDGEFDERRSWTSPAVEGWPDPIDEHEVIAYAQGQLGVLGKTVPEATGASLLMAKITPGAIRCGPIFDLSAGITLSRPRGLGEGSGMRAKRQIDEERLNDNLSFSQDTAAKMGETENA